MSDVSIKMKDGTVREFRERGRPGGSYSQKIRYEASFVVIVDEYENETAIPVSDIAEVKVHSTRGW